MKWVSEDELYVEFDSTVLFQYPEDMSVYCCAAGLFGNYKVFRIGGSRDIAYYRDRDGLYQSGFTSMNAACEACEKEESFMIREMCIQYQNILKRLVDCADNGFDTAELHDIVQLARKVV